MHRYILKSIKLLRSVWRRPDLTGNGERVDITYCKGLDFESLDQYQKSHFRRYEFACRKLPEESTCGDFACGTGYGSALLAEKAQQVIGIDLNAGVIAKARERYRAIPNIKFITADLRSLNLGPTFDAIISFETIEHFREPEIINLLRAYDQALKVNGLFIFSTPYRQEQSVAARQLGFHRTFQIDEKRIQHWFTKVPFAFEECWYQNYQTHTITRQLDDKDFLIVQARKL